tara:strand:- start:2468 stop:3970 length:1503 start_codon:yes stop_codon:yes gene_type:complete
MLKKLLLTTALVLSACSSVKDVPLPFASTNEKATEFFNKAGYHFDQGEWQEARDNFQSALRVDPNFIMANIWGWSEDPVQTRKYRETAIANKENANDAEKIMIEMLEARRNGKASERLELAKELVNKYSSSSEAHVILGNVYTSQDNLDKAIESYENALKVNPDNYNAWKELAKHHIVVGNNNMLPKDKQDKSKAVRYAEEMLRIRPKAPNAHQFRANIERQHSNFDEANKLYQKMVDVCNETGSTAKSTALIISAHNLLFSGQLNNSMTRYDEAIAISESPQTAHNLKLYKAVANLFYDKYYEGLEVLNEMMKDVSETSASQEAVNGNTAQIFWNRMMMQAHNQQKSEAFKSLNQWKKYRKIDLDMDNERAVNVYNATNYAMEAWMHTLFGDYNKAKSLLAKHYEIAKTWESAGAFDTYNGIYGMVYVMQGNPSKALEYFDDRIDPGNYQYYSYFKALALKATQKEEEAKAIFEFIANYNFLSWEVGLTRNLAQKELDS